MSIQLTNRESVKDVIKEMTLEEKALIITGESTFGTHAVDRLGIPSVTMQDNGAGINFRQTCSNLLTQGKIRNEKILERFGGVRGEGLTSELVNIMNHITDREALDEDEKELLDTFLSYIKKEYGITDFPDAFPVNTLLGATWNPEIVYQCAKEAGKQALAIGVDVLLGTPCVNIQRDPLGGRGFEGFSEDPCLTAKLAPQMCIGVQESGVFADVKHFAANNQETHRRTIQETISERALQEIYFPGFKACIQEGKAKNVMTAYNWINGEACSQNKWLLEDILRKEWGFNGFVVSDWGGVYDQVKAVLAGNDLTMPFGDPHTIIEAVKNGSLDEKVLDTCVENFLNAVVEMPVMTGKKVMGFDSAAARKAAYAAAAEGIVLLKNSGVLPLDTNAVVGFYGERCGNFQESGVGSGHVHTDKTSSMVDRTKEIAGAGHVKRDQACGCDAVVVTAWINGEEGVDRRNLKLSVQDQELIRKAVKEGKENHAKVILILNVAGPVDLTEFIEEADAVLCVYFPGEEGGRAAADILFGLVNPSGKLPHTFPKAWQDCPAFGNFPGENEKVLYGEGIFVGYRWYDIRKIEPLFPFGHGLSYTDFSMEFAEKAQRDVQIDKENLQVRIRVSNTGTRAGKEVVQLYIRDVRSTLLKPDKELKDFEKIFLEPGETKEVTFMLKKEAFSSYDPDLGQWVCEPGEFELLAGSSSGDLRDTLKVRILCENPYAYGERTNYKTLIDDPRSLEIIYQNVLDQRISKEDFRRQVVYFSLSQSFRQAFPLYIGVSLPEFSEEERWAIFDKMCRELKQIEVSEDNEASHYKEHEVY